MSETRIDKMQDQRDQLAAALRYILANNEQVEGRAIAEAALFNVPPAMFPGEANIMQMALDAQAASLNRADFYDHDDDYKRQDAESRRNISNHDKGPDDDYNDPRHGQAAEINKGRF